MVAEVSDSIHLRRFCRISLCERVPDESTVRKLTRRLGPETVSNLTRMLIFKATRERRFRPRAVRIDSTVVEADVKYPTDAGLASHGVKALAREPRKLAAADRREQREGAGSLQGDAPAAAGNHAHDPGSLGGGQGAGAEADRADRRVVGALDQGGPSARSARQGQGARARRQGQAQGRRGLEELADRCEKIAGQIKQRVAGEPIKDRIISLFDPDARPIRKGKLGKPNEFGYASQLAEVTENTKPGARGLILPASTTLGNPAKNTLLPVTAQELQRLGISPHEVALDGAFIPSQTTSALERLSPKQLFIAGRQEPPSKRTTRR